MKPAFKSWRKERPIGLLFAAVLTWSAVTGRASAQSESLASRNALPAAPQCENSKDGQIDFRGRLGRAGGASVVQIFAWSQGAVAYAENLEKQLGPQPAAGGSAQTSSMTLADLQTAMAAAKRIPAALAAASTAALVDGQFSCNGFSPGRYLLLAQVQGGTGLAGDSKALIAYYRAEIDTSSIRKHVIVLVTAFRRIASYPPQAP